MTVMRIFISSPIGREVVPKRQTQGDVKHRNDRKPANKAFHASPRPLRVSHFSPQPCGEQSDCMPGSTHTKVVQPLDFAFSPSSTRRRIASGRPGRSSC